MAHRALAGVSALAGDRRACARGAAPMCRTGILTVVAALATALVAVAAAARLYGVLAQPAPVTAERGLRERRPGGAPRRDRGIGAGACRVPRLLAGPTGPPRPHEPRRTPPMVRAAAALQPVDPRYADRRCPPRRPDRARRGRFPDRGEARLGRRLAARPVVVVNGMEGEPASAQGPPPARESSPTSCSTAPRLAAAEVGADAVKVAVRRDRVDAVHSLSVRSAERRQVGLDRIAD